MKKKAMALGIGTLVAFLWSSFSFMALPWHNLDFRSFSGDGQLMTAALRAEATQPGIYIVPNFDESVHRDPEKQKQWSENSRKGPWAYMTVRPQGTSGDMGVSMVIQLLTQLATALIAVWILSKTAAKKLWQKALVVAAGVTAGALMSHVPYWNWWGFPAAGTIVNIVDLSIEWFIAGLAMAKVLSGRG